MDGIGSAPAPVPYEVLWMDCDQSGWIHYSRVARYFESMETELWRHAGLRFDEMLKQGWALPRVNVDVSFYRPLRLGDRGVVRCTVGGLGTSSIRLDMELVPTGDAEPAVTAAYTMVAVSMPSGRPIPVPRPVVEHLRTLPTSG